jgi:hypothetical protein
VVFQGSAMTTYCAPATAAASGRAAALPPVRLARAVDHVEALLGELRAERGADAAGAEHGDRLGRRGPGHDEQRSEEQPGGGLRSHVR